MCVVVWSMGHVGRLNDWVYFFLVTHDGEDAAMKHEDEGAEDTREYPCLLRVTNGKDTKFSTKVCFMSRSYPAPAQLNPHITRSTHPSYPNSTQPMALY